MFHAPCTSSVKKYMRQVPPTSSTFFDMLLSALTREPCTQNNSTKGQEQNAASFTILTKIKTRNITLDNDLHNEKNFVLSLEEINEIEQPSAEARAVLPLLWI